MLAIGEYRGTLDRRSPREATDACVSLRPLSKLSGETPVGSGFFYLSLARSPKNQNTVLYNPIAPAALARRAARPVAGSVGVPSVLRP